MKLAALALSSVLCNPGFGGDIQYSIIKFSPNKSGTEICSGSVSQKYSEIIEQNPSEHSQFSKFFHLCKGIGFSVVYSKDEQFSGFALCARNPEQDFSWEWFDKESELVFKKLQEGGKIEVQFSPMTRIPSIVSIKFITDISLRLESSGTEIITYRINIKKGSVLNLM